MQCNASSSECMHDAAHRIGRCLWLCRSLSLSGLNSIREPSLMALPLPDPDRSVAWRVSGDDAHTADSSAALPLFACVSVVWISDIFPPPCQEIQKRHYHTPQLHEQSHGRAPRATSTAPISSRRRQEANQGLTMATEAAELTVGAPDTAARAARTRTAAWRCRRWCARRRARVRARRSRAPRSASGPTPWTARTSAPPPADL
jgi:hypothetical protein